MIQNEEENYDVVVIGVVILEKTRMVKKTVRRGRE